MRRSVTASPITTAERRGAEASRRQHPHDMRPQQELCRDREPERRSRWPDRVAVPPRNGESERERNRDVGEQHAADRRHPQQRRRVAAHVANAETRSVRPSSASIPQRRAPPRRAPAAASAARARAGAAADRRTPSGPRGSDRRAPGTGTRRRALPPPPAGTRTARPRRAGPRPRSCRRAPSTTATAKNHSATVPRPGRDRAGGRADQDSEASAADPIPVDDGSVSGAQVVPMVQFTATGRSRNPPVRVSCSGLEPPTLSEPASSGRCLRLVGS